MITERLNTNPNRNSRNKNSLFKGKIIEELENGIIKLKTPRAINKYSIVINDENFNIYLRKIKRIQLNRLKAIKLIESQRFDLILYDSIYDIYFIFRLNNSFLAIQGQILETKRNYLLFSIEGSFIASIHPMLLQHSRFEQFIQSL